MQWASQLRTKPRALVLILFVVGLFARLLVGIQGGLNAAPLPSSDSREYDSYAWNLAQGHGYRGISPDVRGADGQLLDHPTAYRSPGTSLLWSALFRIFGHRYDAVRTAHCLLDATNILLIYGIGRLCFGDPAALLAAGLYVFWPTALFYSTLLGSEPLYAFLFTCFIYTALKFAERPSWSRSATAGLLLGCTLLTRGNAIMMVALAIPWALWQFRNAPGVLVRSLAIPLIALAMLVPWTARNYGLFHAFIPFETGGGDVVLGSYNRVVASDPIYYGYWVYPTSELPEYRDQITAPNNEVARDRVEFRLAAEWIRNHPESWWYLLVSRFRRAWTPFLEVRSPMIYRLGMFISWGPVLVLFGFGFFPTATSFFRGGHPGWVLHMGIVSFLMTVSAFWGASRFRYPVEGLCIVLATWSALWIWRRAPKQVRLTSALQSFMSFMRPPAFSLARRLIDDALRNNHTAWHLLALAGFAKSFLTTGLENRLLLRAVAYRRASPGFLRDRIEGQLSPWLEPPLADIWRRKKIGWKRFEILITAKALDKSIILKSPTGDGEKGVLYLSFENNWLRLIEHRDLPRLLEEYFLVVASSSSPPDFSSHWAFAHIGPDPIFVQVSNPSDMKSHERFHHNIRPIPIMASDWINPEFYQPRPHREREIDILMVAGWSRLKRHWLLFRALRKMRRDLRVVLVGQDSEGRTADDVWGEAKAYGVAGRIEIIRDASIEAVTKHQCNSKTSLVLSAREGSSVVTTESFFANAPVGMMYNAHIGSRAYINRQTGVLLHPRTMAAQLSELIEQRESYRPRAWAKASITCFQSTKRLNSILSAYSDACGVPYDREIVPFCWRPDPEYVHEADAAQLAPAYQKLYELYGVVVKGRNVEENALLT